MTQYDDHKDMVKVIDCEHWDLPLIAYELVAKTIRFSVEGPKALVEWAINYTLDNMYLSYQWEKNRVRVSFFDGADDTKVTYFYLPDRADVDRLTKAYRKREIGEDEYYDRLDAISDRSFSDLVREQHSDAEKIDQ